MEVSNLDCVDNMQTDPVKFIHRIINEVILENQETVICQQNYFFFLIVPVVDPVKNVYIRKKCKCTLKAVLSDHSKIDKTKVFKTNGSLMKVESIAECSKRAFCNTFDLH